MFRTVWLNGWVFVYELSGCEFESRCSHVYLSVVDRIFSLNFFVGSFEVCYSFFGFVYVYCLVHQSVVVFCFMFRRKSAARFFFFVLIFLYFSILVMLISVLCYVMFSFLCLYFSILVMFMSVLNSVMFSFLHFPILVMFMSVLCSVMISFLYFSISLMFLKCSLCIFICECICLFLLHQPCVLFDTL